MSEEESVFYVAIEDPIDFRKELLSSSKVIIQLLQRNEHLKELRTEKIQKLFEFSQLMSEITMLIGKLKKAIPETKLRNVPQQKIIEQKRILPEAKPIENNDLRQLQLELHAIEEKLGMLR
jgi:hypothetical protein